jgi:hypothetical protein
MRMHAFINTQHLLYITVLTIARHLQISIQQIENMRMCVSNDYDER